MRTGVFVAAQWVVLASLVGCGEVGRDSAGDGADTGGAGGTGGGGASRGCLVAGRYHPDGESFVAPDGCNSCTCDAGEAVCTEADCACSDLDCAPAPICGESCASPCGCCTCAPGATELIGGVRYACVGDCLEPVRPCMMAASDTTCCVSAVPAASSDVATDPCLRPFPRVAATSEEVCPTPVECDVLCGEEPYPVPRVAAPDENGACRIVDECETDMDCVVATNELDCCACPEAFPTALVDDEPCLVTGPLPADMDCADCSAMSCGPCSIEPIVARCEPNDASVRVCVSALLVTSLDALPGRTFQISASRHEPVESGCQPPDETAVYSLSFTDDGAGVTAARLDRPDEVVLEGLLTDATDAAASYAIDDGWTGGELVLRVVSGVVVAELTLFGSGVPITWCIHAVVERPS